MNTVNVQVWVDAQTVAAVAKYMELTGCESRQLSTVARVALDVLGGLLKKKGIGFLDEAEALRYLQKRGFPIASRKDKQKKVIEVLQEEALREISPEQENKKKELAKALEEEGL